MPLLLPFLLFHLLPISFLILLTSTTAPHLYYARGSPHILICLVTCAPINRVPISTLGTQPTLCFLCCRPRNSIHLHGTPLGVKVILHVFRGALVTPTCSPSICILHVKSFHLPAFPYPPEHCSTRHRQCFPQSRTASGALVREAAALSFPYGTTHASWSAPYL